METLCVSHQTASSVLAVPQSGRSSCYLGIMFTRCRGAWGFPRGSAVKSPPANAGDAGSIPGTGRSPGGGNGNPLWYSRLENPTDRGAWRAAVHEVVRRPEHTHGRSC